MLQPTNTKPTDPQAKQKFNPIQKKILSTIPESYFQNQQLNTAIQLLPPHYSFEIQKTLHRIDSLAEQLGKQALKVSLQFPEGLMLFACVISDILASFAKVKIETIILGDLTYGACCVDDISSDQMGCDLLVHYGHSCLIPITETRRKTLYIFVEIQIDIDHFVQTVNYNFQADKKDQIYLMGTIQFNSSLYLAKHKLSELGFCQLVIPQEKPRSGGQVLGCTSPQLPIGPNKNVIIFLCDGRFHMQAAMIANPTFSFYQYDPYTRAITEEKYATSLMLQRRTEEIMKAQKGTRKRLCFILGSLGRQGNTGILDRLIQKVKGVFSYMVLISSEVYAQLLETLEVDFFVQIACPRLSIDWAYGTPKPLLTPYELYAMLDQIDISKNYSMDYYSHNGGPWSNFYGKAPQKKDKNKQSAKSSAKVKLQFQKQCGKEECNCSKQK